MAESNSEPTYVTSSQYGFCRLGGKRPETTKPQFGAVSVTHDFGKTIGWQIKEGRTSSRKLTDTGGLILNQSAVKSHRPSSSRWNDHKMADSQASQGDFGVVGDMVMESPYSPVRPTVFNLPTMDGPRPLSCVFGRWYPSKTLWQRLEPVFRRYNPVSPFSYQFTNEKYAQKSLRRTANREPGSDLLPAWPLSFPASDYSAWLVSWQSNAPKRWESARSWVLSVFALWKLLSTEFVLLVDHFLRHRHAAILVLPVRVAAEI